MLLEWVILVVAVSALVCLVVLLNKLFHIPRELFVVFAQRTGESAIW
jgi:hypothetical protein